MSYAVAVEGLDQLTDIVNLKETVVTAARQAVNRSLDKTRTRSAKLIAMQVNFTARYLSPNEGRLTVSRKASNSRLEGAILGRHRPTSLARFAHGGVSNKAGVTVEVKPGSARFLKRAFLIKLRAGTANIETQHNLGLAIRLKPGETIANKKQMVKISGNLYLLYGPSVDQVFNKVRDDVAPDALTFLEDEFFRLMALRNG